MLPARPNSDATTGAERQGAAPTAQRARPRDASRVDAILELQRLAGNRATAERLRLTTGAHDRARGPDRSRSSPPMDPIVQRLDIYGQAAAASSTLPVDVAADFTRQVEAGNQAAALRVVVEAMTGRGELDARLLRTHGEGELWRVGDTGGLAAAVSFQSPFPDPDDPSHRLPNPRFAVNPSMLAAGRSDALESLHMGILHEFRHVRQAAERVNRPSVAGGARAPGYANDPDEFDAYLSEVEMSYDRMHMYNVAIQAGVHWEFLAADDRVPFQARWTAAQARIRRVLGYGVDILMDSPRAGTYREQMREAERRAREAWERHGE
jgi:hypothetical protein